MSGHICTRLDISAHILTSLDISANVLIYIIWTQFYASTTQFVLQIVLMYTSLPPNLKKISVI